MIIVQNLTKTYKLYSSPLDRLNESFHPLRKQYHQEFFALKDVSFEINKGESVGIIGNNGSGKSTILKILANVVTPTSGTVHVDGKVSALLELGAGFSPEMTGIENVYFNGLLAGITKIEMNEKLDDILSFADIGEHVYQPVKTYSSGMFVRLAFAVAIGVRPDILIIDEALSVGDIFFQQKCYAAVQKLINSGITAIFVSHDTTAVIKLCDRCILLHGGKIAYDGTAIQGVSRYLAASSHVAEASLIQTSTEEEHVDAISSSRVKNLISPSAQHYGVGGASILSTHVYDLNGQQQLSVRMLEKLTFYVLVKSEIMVANPSIGIHLFDRLGNLVFASGTHRLGCEIPSLHPGSKAKVKFEISFTVQQGQYLFSIGISDMQDMENNIGYVLDRVDMLGPLTVTPSIHAISPFGGIAQLPMEATLVNACDADGKEGVFDAE